MSNISKTGLGMVMEIKTTIKHAFVPFRVKHTDKPGMFPFQ